MFLIDDLFLAHLDLLVFLHLLHLGHHLEEFPSYVEDVGASHLPHRGVHRVEEDLQGFIECSGRTSGGE